VKDFLKRWAITTVAVLVAAAVLPGIRFETVQGLLLATLLLGLLNAFIRPLLTLLTLPLVLVTLGFFYLIINATLLYVVGRIKVFHVDNFWTAFWGGLIISFVTLVLNSLLGGGNTSVRVQRGRSSRPRSRADDNDDGPVIDV
jgi:putative membrane protein